MIMEFFGVRILLSTFIACDTWLFMNGFNSILHECKTDEEKEIRQLKINILRKKAERS